MHAMNAKEGGVNETEAVAAIKQQILCRSMLGDD
jgi:hypothetical protein